MTLKVFHTGDLHYCPEHLDEVDRCFEFAVDRSIAERCDVAVITGDLFDHRIELHQPAVTRVLSRIQHLADYMPVLILQGTFSHDQPGSLDVFRTLGARHPVHVADSIQQVGLYKKVATHRDLSDTWEGVEFSWDSDAVRDFGRLETHNCAGDLVALFGCLPPVHKGALAATFGAENAGLVAGEQTYNLMRGWSVANETARQQDIPAIVLAHGTVTGCITERGCPMAGMDWELTTGTLFASACSAAMLSHIHKHQAWQQDGRMIAYAGSPGRLHFGEEDTKGFLIWTVEADRSDFQFVPTPAKRLLQIDFSDAPDLEQLQQQLANANGAHVRVRWEIDEEHRSSVDKAAIEVMLRNAGAAEVKLEGRVRPIQRQRAAGITQAASLSDKLAKWADVSGQSPAMRDELVERLQMLEHMEPEAIAEQIANKPVIVLFGQDAAA